MSFPTNALFNLIRRRPSTTHDDQSSDSMSHLLGDRSTKGGGTGARSADSAASAAFGKVAPTPAVPAPYEIPPASGECFLVALPEEVAVKVFGLLDRVSLVRCKRLCKSINTLISSNPSISLHLLLSLSSLRLNPAALLPSPSDPTHVPPSAADLLSRLQSRLDGFARLKPRSTRGVMLLEPEGRLYEFLEGVLVRGLGGTAVLPREVAVYDLRKMVDFTDEELERPTWDRRPGPDFLRLHAPHMDGGAGAGAQGAAATASTSASAAPNPAPAPITALPVVGHEDGEFMAINAPEDQVVGVDGEEIVLEYMTDSEDDFTDVDNEDDEDDEDEDSDEVGGVQDAEMHDEGEGEEHEQEQEQAQEQEQEQATEAEPAQGATASLLPAAVPTAAPTSSATVPNPLLSMPPYTYKVSEAQRKANLARAMAHKIRRTQKFGFDVAEFAVDPGQDLFVAVEVKTHGPRQYGMTFHLLTLSTFEPHPLAAQPTLEWPATLQRRNIQLGFQICDDGFFVLNHNVRVGTYDQICGWQWTSGRLAVTLKAFPTMSFESFILLTPTSFLVPTIVTHLDPDSNLQDDLNNPADLSWTHHIHLYAFPAFSAVPLPSHPSEPVPPPHSVTHIATFDLPEFQIDLARELPPPRMTIRTDPPPRHTLPTHPEERVEPFAAEPTSGIITLEFFCQTPSLPWPHYVMICPKTTLSKYLPAPRSPLLTQAFPRQAPVIAWKTLAPYVRFLGPDLLQSSWVCYVYQDRYITNTSGRRPGHDPQPIPKPKMRLYDFNPLRVRRELLSRQPSGPVLPKRRSVIRRLSLSASLGGAAGKGAVPPPCDGEHRGITLVTAETVLPAVMPLSAPIRTGSELPFVYAEKECAAEVLLIDDQRIVAVMDDDEYRRNKARLEVMEF